MRVAILTLCLCAMAGAREYMAINVLVDRNASALERRSAELLADQVRRLGAPSVILGSAEGPQLLTVMLGVAGHYGELDDTLVHGRIAAPTQKDPGAEGYLIHKESGEDLVMAAGVDERGVMYAVGELLRQMDVREHTVVFPDALHIWTAPAFEIRGIMVSQSATIKELTHCRDWTEDDWEQAVLRYVLAGANTISIGYRANESEAQFKFVQSLGIKTLVSLYPNAGCPPEKPEWQAVEAIGRPGYLCLSVPDAWKYIVDRADKSFAAMPHMDYIRFYSGDGGGCECDNCAPFGAKYIQLCHELADVVHKYHPDAQIIATNQKLDNAGDTAIFQYLNEHPGWLRGFGYGPGSNAMGWMPGRRQDHRMDLFQYPAFGAMDRYLREVVHELPKGTDIVFYTDITHWVYSQYGLMDHQLIPDRNKDLPPLTDRALYSRRPDPFLAQVYNRRTFHARPRAYYEAFQQTERYGIGDAIYSEGFHDDFNQWMWMRLLWDPHQTVERVVDDYAKTFFGVDVVARMAKVIFRMEDNLSEPLLTNPGIPAQVADLHYAGKELRPGQREKNYLWRLYLQKALVDEAIQLRVMRQTSQYRDVVDLIKKRIDGDSAQLAVECKKLLDAPTETDEMRVIQAEADQLGKESDALYGLRNEGLFNLEQDFVGLGWVRRQVEIALAATGEAQREALKQIAFYEDAGEGGFYDDAGDPAKSPHLVYGWPYGDGDFSGTNRPSQRSAAFTTDEKRGVTFAYQQLDKSAQYRVRFTLVRPKYLPRFGKFQHQTSESIYADDWTLQQFVELPEYESQFFEYDIPKAATQDGELKLRFEKAPGVGEGGRAQTTVWRNTGGWGTLVSEVWLMKKAE